MKDVAETVASAALRCRAIKNTYPYLLVAQLNALGTILHRIAHLRWRYLANLTISKAIGGGLR